jgi:hypothetical protein
MLSTRNVKETSSRINAKMSPGNADVKIHSLELTEGYNHIQNKSYNLILNVETMPVTAEGFEGFLVDKDRPELGRFLGQVGRVKYQAYSFQDGETKTGRKQNRDNDILLAVCKIADALSLRDELDNAVDSAALSRIEDLMPLATRIFKGKYLSICAAGRGYKDKGGYTQYELYLPYPKEGKNPFTALQNQDNLITFTEANHISAPKEATPVANFEPAGNDFEI